MMTPTQLPCGCKLTTEIGLGYIVAVPAPCVAHTDADDFRNSLSKLLMLATGKQLADRVAV